LLEVIKKYAPTKSIFGVCLGQQAIAEAFGGSLINFLKSITVLQLKQLKPMTIKFSKFTRNLEVGRYHSWAVNPDDFPKN
jgi:anthranilate synthase component 2